MGEGDSSMEGSFWLGVSVVMVQFSAFLEDRKASCGKIAGGRGAPIWVEGVGTVVLEGTDKVAVGMIGGHGGVGIFGDIWR